MEREWNQDFVLGGDIRRIHGSFGPDTANPPINVRGRGFTVAYVSPGLFRVTVADDFKEVLDFQAHLQLNAAGDQYAIAGPVDLTARTFDIFIWDISGGATANVAANANNRVSFVIVGRKTGWSLA